MSKGLSKIPCKNCGATLDYRMSFDEGRTAASLWWCPKCGAILKRESLGPMDKYKDVWSFPESVDLGAPKKTSEIPEPAKGLSNVELLAHIIEGRPAGPMVAHEDVVKLIAGAIDERVCAALKEGTDADK